VDAMDEKIIGMAGASGSILQFVVATSKCFYQEP